MIYHLYFGLIMAGFYSVSTLLGSYMILYAGAREIDLGFLFMIQPLTIFARPLICAQADRHQSHKQMLAFFAVLTAVSYIPFAVMPFVVARSSNSLVANERARFWLMVVFHSIGSFGFCGVRSLGDATTISYAKRFGTDYARYRKYGSMSYGLFAFLIGYINQHWLLPDFVPGLIMHCTCMLALGLLVFAWPDEYFVMTVSKFQVLAPTKEELSAEASKLPSASETAKHVLSSLTCCNVKQTNRNNTKHQKEEQQQQKRLSFGQQMAIFKLLVRRDFRLALYLLAILFMGLVALAGPNFVFTYLEETCKRKGTCNGAQLAGLVMISYCTIETIGYMILDKFRGKLNRVFMLELVFLSVAVHYYFYGFLLDSMSPYWFLVESLHGIEYSIGLSCSVELGYYFAREVDLLLPELRAKRIISDQDDEQLVRVSLLATLCGCYTFISDGIGCILGALVFGLTTGLYSFRVTWIIIGSMSAIGFLTLFFSWLVGKCLHIRPKILTIRDQAAKQRASVSSC